MAKPANSKLFLVTKYIGYYGIIGCPDGSGLHTERKREGLLERRVPKILKLAPCNMQVTSVNDVKIYNLSAAKSLPDWLSDRKRRKLSQKDDDIRRRVELIQDFTMPDVSNCVRMSKDGQYIIATGTYKPRVRCYDVTNLSMKFERCLDAEVINMHILSDSYEKLLFLEEERYVEFHVQYGRYHRTRIPKFGRDFCVDESTAEVYFVGAGPDIYRMNLEQGRYMAPMNTQANSLLCCDLNKQHGLLVVGTVEGQVEAWDPRDKERVAVLDCALSALVNKTSHSTSLPSVSALKFKDALHLTVGTQNGQILMYDIRSRNALLTKEHQYGLPIKCLDFCSPLNLILSLDNKVLKLWNQHDGQTYASIESEFDLNHLCLVPGTGLLFLANESPQIQTYYIPNLGAAPKWCSFLDNITEELEESEQPVVFDDYKFVTRGQLDELGLSHLIGSSMLRSYMHGYFMDTALYNRVQSMSEQFGYEKYKKEKIRAQLDAQRINRVAKKDSVKVNKALKERLENEEKTQSNAKKNKQRAKVAQSVLTDDRFQSIFTNPEFQIDAESEEFQLLNPALEKLEKSKRKRQQKLLAQNDREEEAEDDNEIEGRPSSDEESESGASSSSGDEAEFGAQMKKTYQKLKRDREIERRAEKLDFEMRAVDQFEGWDKQLNDGKIRENLGKLALKDRIEVAEPSVGAGSGHEVTFKVKRKTANKEMQAAQHRKDRKRSRRSAAEINRTLSLPAGVRRKMNKY